MTVRTVEKRSTWPRLVWRHFSKWLLLVPAHCSRHCLVNIVYFQMQKLSCYVFQDKHLKCTSRKLKSPYHFSVNPLDVVKIRMQKQVKHADSSTNQCFSSSSSSSSTNKRFCIQPSYDLYRKLVLKRYGEKTSDWILLNNVLHLLLLPSYGFALKCIVNSMLKLQKNFSDTFGRDKSSAPNPAKTHDGRSMFHLL